MRAEVYRCPEWKLWAVSKYDSDDNLIGDSEWMYYKYQARQEAESMLASGEVSEIRIFNIYGEHQKSLTNY